MTRTTMTSTSVNPLRLISEDGWRFWLIDPFSSPSAVVVFPTDVDQPRIDAYFPKLSSIQFLQKEAAMDRSNGNLEKFPDGWIDPLQLYGAHLNDLKLFGCSLDAERDTLEGLIEKNGARWVWDRVCRDRTFETIKFCRVRVGHETYT